MGMGFDIDIHKHKIVDSSDIVWSSHISNLVGFSNLSISLRGIDDRQNISLLFYADNETVLRGIIANLIDSLNNI